MVAWSTRCAAARRRERAGLAHQAQDHEGAVRLPSWHSRARTLRYRALWNGLDARTRGGSPGAKRLPIWRRRVSVATASCLAAAAAGGGCGVAAAATPGRSAGFRLNHISPKFL